MCSATKAPREPVNLSLTARTSLITALLLAVCVTVAGIILYSKVRNGLREEIEAQCLGQIGVLQSSIESDDGTLQLNGAQSALLQQNQWRIATLDDQSLWTYNWTSESDSIVKTREVFVGNASGPLASGQDLKKSAAEGEERHAARDAWQLPSEEHRIGLKISVRMPRTRMNADLHHLSIALLTIGPLTVLVSALLMALFLRWQLRPLNVMAREAAGIGPENTTARIGPAGSAAECVQLRASINRMLERLELGLQRERNFAAVAAHELRSPLAQLRTSMEVTLRKERERAEYKQTVEECLGDVKRLQALATNLLLITRGFESDPQHTAAPATDVRSAIERARRESNSDAIFDSSSVIGLSVRGREELLVAALRNVLENAARYAPGAPARVNVKTDGTGVRVAVQDSGPGVPSADRERIFDPLIRLDAARTIRDDTHGFGLGLTVARAAVRACGGDLICQPRADGNPGAEFVFVFPLALT